MLYSLCHYCWDVIKKIMLRSKDTLDCFTLPSNWLNSNMITLNCYYLYSAGEIALQKGHNILPYHIQMIPLHGHTTWSVISEQTLFVHVDAILPQPAMFPETGLCQVKLCGVFDFFKVFVFFLALTLCDDLHLSRNPKLWGGTEGV